MSAYYSGTDGWMYVQEGEADQDETGSFLPGDKAAAVTDWSIQSSMAPIETTTLGQTDTVFTHGLRTTTGSCTLLYYKQSNQSNKAGLLINRLMKQRDIGLDPDMVGHAEKPDKVAFKLGLTDQIGEDRFIYFRAYLTSVSTAMSVGEIMSVSAQFRVIGAPNRVAFDNSN